VLSLQFTVEYPMNPTEKHLELVPLLLLPLLILFSIECSRLRTSMALN